MRCLAIVLAVPFGILANKKGRNLVLIIGVTGQMLSEAWIIIVCESEIPLEFECTILNLLGYFNLPFWLIFVSSVLKSSGGGALVLSAMIHAIISDVISPEMR